MKVHNHIHRKSLPRNHHLSLVNSQRAQRLMAQEDDQEESQDTFRDDLDEDTSMDDESSPAAVRTNGIE